jgi:hypothetical protein
MPELCVAGFAERWYIWRCDLCWRRTDLSAKERLKQIAGAHTAAIRILPLPPQSVQMANNRSPETRALSPTSAKLLSPAASPNARTLISRHSRSASKSVSQATTEWDSSGSPLFFFRENIQEPIVRLKTKHFLRINFLFMRRAPALWSELSGNNACELCRLFS